MRGIDEDHSLYPDYICPKDPNAVDTDETKMGNQMDWVRKPKPDADFGSKKWSNQLDRLSDPDMI